MYERALSPSTGAPCAAAVSESSRMKAVQSPSPLSRSSSGPCEPNGAGTLTSFAILCPLVIAGSISSHARIVRNLPKWVLR